MPADMQRDELSTRNNHAAVGINERTRAALGGKKHLLVIEGANHLFEKFTSLDRAIRHATDGILTPLNEPAGQMEE